MKTVSYLLALVGLASAGAGVGIGSATAQEVSSLELRKQADLACEDALRKNTIEALEEYLRLYPDAPTACLTLARNALQGFQPEGNSASPASRQSAAYGG